MLRVERARRPGERRQHQHAGADDVDVGVAMERIGAHEQTEAEQAERESDEHEGRGPAPCGAQPVEEHHPEWYHCHEQGSDARWHPLFRPHDEAVSTYEQKHATDESSTPIGARWPSGVTPG